MSRVWSGKVLGKRLGKALEIGCWVAGGAMLSLYFGTRLVGEIEREQGIEAFAQARVPAQDPNTLNSTLNSAKPFETPRPFAWQDFPPPPVMAASEPVSISQDQLDFPIDGRLVSPQPVPGSESMPIALLSIARVGLEVPVFSDTSERNLNRGAGWVKGTAAPDDGGNIAIAAHRDGYFRVLKDVELGDVLVLESFAQETNYRVTGISIVEPDDTSSLFETETAAVTLVTCYPFYFVGNAPQRYIVRAEALSEENQIEEPIEKIVH